MEREMNEMRQNYGSLNQTRVGPTGSNTYYKMITVNLQGGKLHKQFLKSLHYYVTKKVVSFYAKMLIVKAVLLFTQNPNPYCVDLGNLEMEELT